ncbi:MAG: BREX-1 system adenine-specific DNA-methyltransferase PglX [Desulfobacteraceae bacterium]|nr:BREX-1 system adenine-specific DNA-methyltransferase PglX [Desulfobacteraceae bacterium]
MDTSKIKAYAPKARNDFIEAVTQRANRFGIFGDEHIEEISFKGDVAMIGDRAVTQKEGELREKLVQRVQSQGFDMMIRSMAYTWFNRFVALRYMELHDYLDHGLRVLSHPNGSDVPEIVSRAADVDLPGLDKDKVLELRLAGNRDNELYRMIIVAQCNALHQAMPFLFEPIDSETELLLPDNLLHSDSPIRKLVTELDESLWQDVEIIGWIYQFYISEKKSEVIGKTVKSEDIPAATQLFTPNWIVKYMTQNTLGRMWLATYPDSPLRSRMDFYIEPAEQEPEVQKQLDAITPNTLNPEEITFMDPACGSGHILVEAYDIFKQIYQERGYRTRDIPSLILKNNLFGLEIDDRAAQLAGFAVLMRARADDRNIFSRNRTPLNIMSIQPSTRTDLRNIDLFFKGEDCAQVRDGLKELVTLFENAKTFGSLITIPDHLAEKLDTLQKAVDEKIGTGFTISGAQNLVALVRQARMLAGKYDCVVTNPPYMGNKYLNPDLKTLLKNSYSGFEKDLFSAFVVRDMRLAKNNGQLGYMSPYVWMFISSYENLRDFVINQKLLTSLVQLEYSGFAGATVPICTYTILNQHIPEYLSSFIRLADFRGAENQGPKTKEAINNPDCGWYYTAKPHDFQKIPGSPIAYWATDSAFKAFEENPTIADLYMPRQGLATTDNNRFVRFWFEVNITKIGFGMKSRQQAAQTGMKWFPMDKGGGYRKWYGNNFAIVNWQHDGSEIKQNILRKYPYLKGNPDYVAKNPDFYFKPGVTWGKITSSLFSARYTEEGFIFSDAGSKIPTDNSSDALTLIIYLNTPVTTFFLSILSQTLNFEQGTIARLPFKDAENFSPIGEKLVKISKSDWDLFEISWDFKKLKLLQSDNYQRKIKSTCEKFYMHCHETTMEMKRLEEENNRIFIKAYGLQDELTSDVPLEEITLTCNPYYRYGGNKSEDELEAQLQTDTIKELISYAIGCMMGRYSLDEPGLIYAREGNIGFDPERYKTFPADDDAIIPVMDRDWFEDDATHRFVEFIKTAWPEEHLEENLGFVAESLGTKNNEAPVETIRRYISTSFFKDHLRMYKRRPIYWLFSSGKHKAFECLVYLHRYNESTLSRMRSLYVTPLQGNFSARMQYLQNELDAAPSASAKKKLQKEMDLLGKKQAELAAFDDQLRHLADRKINLDLDDGVKVNYAKFGTLLAETKAVCGK